MGIEFQILNAIQGIRTAAGDFLMPIVSDAIILWPLLIESV